MLCFLFLLFFRLGPCPPCPKTVRVSCHCGSAAPIVRRCSAKEWSCGKPCGKLLSCGHHNCETPCHSGIIITCTSYWVFTSSYSILNLRRNSHSTQFAGDCLPCPKESVQNCLCGKFQSKRSCANPEWQCEQVTVMWRCALFIYGHCFMTQEIACTIPVLWYECEFYAFDCAGLWKSLVVWPSHMRTSLSCRELWWLSSSREQEMPLRTNMWVLCVEE